MYIHEATKTAVRVCGCIVRPKWRGHVHIKPTNTPECCWVLRKGKAPCPRWEPKAEDLMADDWEITSEELNGMVSL